MSGLTEAYEETFVDFPHLLYKEKLQPGTIASAVEQYGVYTWDRFGRLRNYLLGTPEAEAALNLLAAHYHNEYVSIHAHPYDLFDYAEQAPYGWPKEKQPDFKNLEESTIQEPKKPSPRHSMEKANNANAVIIGGLLQFIKGEMGNQRHPDFQSEAQLIAFLEKKLGGYLGVSERNLKDKFARAKEAFKV